MSQELLKALAAALGVNAPATKRTKNAKNRNKGRRSTSQPMTDEQRAANRLKNDMEVIKAFVAKGYEDVKPRVTVLTYDKWIEQGRRVKKGEKSIRVGPFPLFHRDQTQPLTEPVATVAVQATTQESEIATKH